MNENQRNQVYDCKVYRVIRHSGNEFNGNENGHRIPEMSSIHTDPSCDQKQLAEIAMISVKSEINKVLHSQPSCGSRSVTGITQR